MTLSLFRKAQRTYTEEDRDRQVPDRQSAPRVIVAPALDESHWIKGLHANVNQVGKG